MNRYFDAQVSWCDPIRAKQRPGRSNYERKRRPMQLPDFFKCPSDSTAAVPMASGTPDSVGDADTPFQTWDWWGTSYPINWYWAYYFKRVQVVGYQGTDAPLTGSDHRRMLNSKSGTGAAEWVLFYENQMNFAMEAARPRGYDPPEVPRLLTGWHRQLSMHAAGFYDGHAEYRYFDTNYIDGPGWTTWPNRPWEDTYENWSQYQDN